MNWNPIISAPHDGSWIIVKADGPECGLAIVSWDADWSGGWWMCDDGKCAVELPLRGPEPTHWAPLPS